MEFKIDEFAQLVCIMVETMNAKLSELCKGSHNLNDGFTYSVKERGIVRCVEIRPTYWPEGSHITVTFEHKGICDVDWWAPTDGHFYAPHLRKVLPKKLVDFKFKTNDVHNFERAD